MNKKPNTKIDSSKVRNILLSCALAVQMATQSIMSQASDPLVDKLVSKGILTPEEANQLRKQNESTTTELKNKIQIPEWVQNLRITGDFGVRADHITVDADDTVDRFRPRYRFRIGTIARLLDNIDVELRLASGEADRSPLASGYTTFQDDAAKKHVWIDRAYAAWTPIKNDNFKSTITLGKMPNPFDTSSFLFDSDYTPEGVALQLQWKLLPNNTVSISPAVFALDEIPTSSHDPYLGGIQMAWQATWTTNLSTVFRIGAFGMSNSENLDNNAVPNVGVGNTRDAQGRLAYHYNPIVGGAALTYLVGNVGIYPGPLPVTISVELVHNPAAPENNDGWNAGITLGHLGKKGTWTFEYRYLYLESDAWYEEFGNDDSLAYYSIAPIGSGKTPGAYSGTNRRGHYIAAGYALTSAVSLGARAYVHELIDVPANTPNPLTYHLQMDIMVKF